jgi:hypothetical protein
VNLYINDDGDIELDTTTNNLRMVSGDDEILQIVLRNLETFLGEWFLDSTLGVPWFQSILIKNPSIETIDAAVIDVIGRSKGVLSIQRYESELDTATRELSISFSIQTVSGIIDFSKDIKLG